MKFPNLDEATLDPFQRIANFLAPKGLGRYTLALITGGMLIAFWTILTMTTGHAFPVLSSSMVLAIMGAVIYEMRRSGSEKPSDQLPLDIQLRLWRYAAFGMLLLLLIVNGVITVFGTNEHTGERAILLFEATFCWTLLSFASCKPYAPSVPPAQASAPQATAPSDPSTNA